VGAGSCWDKEKRKGKIVTELKLSMKERKEKGMKNKGGRVEIEEKAGRGEAGRFAAYES